MAGTIDDFLNAPVDEPALKTKIEEPVVEETIIEKPVVEEPAVIEEIATNETTDDLPPTLLEEQEEKEKEATADTKEEEIVLEEEKEEKKEDLKLENFLSPEEKIEDIMAESPEENLDAIIDDLETVDEDFLAEAQAKKEEEEKEDRRKKGVKEEEFENEKEKEIELTPLAEEDGTFDQIKQLSVENVNAFIKENGGKTEEAVVEEKKDDEIKGSGDIQIKGLAEFELTQGLWEEFNFSPEILAKVKNRVKVEIKSFMWGEILPTLGKMAN